MTELIEKLLGVNWRTTAGALAALGVVVTEIAKLIDGDSKTVASWELISMNLAVAWGLFHARDAKVTSEKAGAK